MNNSNFYKKAGISLLGFSLFFGGTQAAIAASLNISNTPLILNESVPPNLILTLDDSGSMRQAYAPESAEDYRDYRRIKSSAYNSMYYDPTVTYEIPTKYDSSGNESGAYTTSFTNAYYNGFKPSLGGLNLSTGYRVSWWYKPTVAHSTTFTANDPDYGSGRRQFADNPSADFGAATISTDTTSSSTEATNQYVGTNTSSNTCPTSKSATSSTDTDTTTNSDGTTTTVKTTTQNSYSSISCTGSKKNWKLYATVTATTTVVTTITRPNLTQTGVPAYYYVYDESQTNCSSDVEDDDCYRRVWVTSTSGSDGSDERQNFAIWYSFYRNRALATMSAARLSFADLSPSARVTWQSLNDCTTLNGTASGCGDNKFREFTPAQRGRFFSWLDTLDFYSGTPLRAALDRAGKFLKTDTAWQKYPNDSSQSNTTANTYACRPSYHVLMTDGIWNGGDGSPGTPFWHDGASFTPTDGKAYTSARTPYGDSTSNTLADLAMHYWATDLRSGLANELKPYRPFRSDSETTEYWDPRNDPATWQHMVNFTMGLGLTRGLSQAGLAWEGNTFAGTGYQNLKSGAKSWPAPSTDSSNNVYDLWHAAINSRGEFFSVDSPDAMVQAFDDIINRIADRTTTAARPAVSASFVSDDDGSGIESNVYATQFSSEDWSGELSKTRVGADQAQSRLWSAKANNQSALATVKMTSATASSGLQDFTWSNLSDAQRALLDKNPDSLVNEADGRGAARLAYIRGNRANEGNGETNFRRRSTVIGDIVNSSPVIVGTPSYLAYLADAIENPVSVDDPDGRDSYQSYAEFRADYARRTQANTSGRKEMVYVGANDGMLHGINADSGVSEFAFVPSAVMPNLFRLTGQNYDGGEHRFFVDGSPIVRDVYFGDDTGWRSVLVGTLRAGGKAVFALDVTDPDDIKLLWEFDAIDTDGDAMGDVGDADLGYTFAQPEIVRLHSGQWAVLLGNGYNSTSDKAALMVIDIETGELLKKLVVPDVVEGSGSTAVILPNGLSSVRAADNNGDGLADYAYAGDLQGNLWRFDLIPTGNDGTDAAPFSRETLGTVTTDDFKIAYGGRPLFTAKDSTTSSNKRQAITIQPSLVRHPTRLGYLVLIGTGKYFEGSDANVDTGRAMTLYGIWDRNTKAEPTNSTTSLAEERGNLAEQTFDNQHNNATVGVTGNQASNDIRILSQNTVAWYHTNATDYSDDSSVAKWGWQLDLQVGSTKLGEMVVSNMAASGSTLFFSSLTPNQDPCADGADTWLYAIDAYTGGRTQYNVLDLSKDGVVDDIDAYSANVVSGVRFPALGGFNLAPGNKIYGSDGANDPATIGDDPNSSGRQSWHIISEDL